MTIMLSEYKSRIGELKQRIRQSQIKAAVKVNTELLQLYFRNFCWSWVRDLLIMDIKCI